MASAHLCENFWTLKLPVIMLVVLLTGASLKVVLTQFPKCNIIFVVVGFAPGLYGCRYDIHVMGGAAAHGSNASAFWFFFVLRLILTVGWLRTYVEKYWTHQPWYR